MTGYIALFWPAAEPPEVAAAREAVAGAPRWRAAIDADHWFVALGDGPAPPLRRLPAGRGFVLGDLHRRSFRPLGDEIESVVLSRRLSQVDTARELAARFWGRYVALITDPAATTIGIFRDPSGALEAMTWRVGDAQAVASTWPDWLPPALEPDLSIVWPVVSRWLETASASAVSSGLAGLASVTPGSLRAGPGEAQIWRPAQIARDPLAAREAGSALPALLDQVLAAQLHGATGVLAEVSGGLDSAIVAASLASVGGGKVRQWLNYHAADGEGDERCYARAVADRWGFSLTEAVKPPFAISEDLLAGAAGGLRPGFSALDALRDLDVAARVRDVGADRIVTGQGGDMVFYQLATPLLARDHLTRRGLRGLVSPYLMDLARWTGKSIWSVTAGALARHARWEGERAVGDHPWLAGAGELPPGKRAQIALLAQKLPLNIENRRAQAAGVLHPLLSQPIVELCLRVPADELTAGGRDRALARNAFAERLPEAVRERRGKGELTGYYARMIADGLPFLRPYLLEGRLAGEGLIDRTRFEEMLRPEHLLWRGEGHVITAAATVEAWVRHWEGMAKRRA